MSGATAAGPPDMPTRRWIVEGQVQGVGFRWFVKGRASRLGLDGMVRNLPDASVEVVASGTDEKLDELETALRKGPPAAEVHQLRKLEPQGGIAPGSGFTISR